MVLIILSLQVGYFIFQSFPSNESVNSFSQDLETQAKIDILKQEAFLRNTVKIYPFNPNFISDFKGYTLGMSVEEIDRLHQFRSKNKYANSSEEFQSITQVSDSLLKQIAPYFKFPEWTQKSKKYAVKSKSNSILNSSPPSKGLVEDLSKVAQIKDLNLATAEDLQTVNGIGEKLSARIIKFRDRLGGFLVDEQLKDVYYLEPDVAARVLKKFKVFNKPEIQTININTSSAYEISSLVYINYAIAKEIVKYRNSNGAFSDLNELENIDVFPSDKIDRIALYLSL